MTIRADHPKLIDMLRKKSETGKVGVSIHESPQPQKMRRAKELLREYFDVMDVPDDENGLVDFIINRFTDQLEHYQALKDRYSGHNYPDRELVPQAIVAIQKVLVQKKDNIALIEALLDAEDELFECKEQMQRVEEFFKNQVKIFDEAVSLEVQLRDDLDYIARENEANEALNKIRLIVVEKQESRKVYRRIPELNGLMETVRAGYSRQLDKKRRDVLNISSECLSKIYAAAGDDGNCRDAVDKAERYYKDMDETVRSMQGITLMEGKTSQMWSYMDKTCQRIAALKEPPKPTVDPVVPEPLRVVKKVYRQVIFQAKTLHNPQEIDAYVEEVRKSLLFALEDCDELRVK